MSSSRAPFLVPGIGYIVLGLATAGLGLLWIPPALAVIRARQAGPAQMVPLATFGFIIALFAGFYVAIGVAILRRRWRLFVIVGASISCVMLPFGTVLGLVFLLWTRCQWPGRPVGFQ